jgi:putative flippase GtrA
MAGPRTRRKPRIRSALPRFAVVGLAGVGVNQGLLFALHGLAGWPIVIASALATETAIVHNYVGNELATFHHRRLDVGRLLRFNAVSLGALVLTVGTLWALQHLTPWHYLVDNLVAIGAGTVWNFAVNFGWTWRD